MKAVHKIGVAQLKVGPCKAANLEIVERLAAEAKGKGCEMLFLPENADFIGQGKEETFALSEKMDGETVGTFKNIAKKHNLWINVGSFHEVLEDDTKIGNTQLMLNAEGDVLELYRKAHLFDVDVPGGRSYRESASTVGGSSYKTADTPVGRVGMTTCYDLRFPYMYSELAFRAHSDIITVPSAFMVPTGKVHWEVLLRARAIETQTFIIAAAQAGAHNPTRSSYGHSLVVDPWGTVLLDMGDEENTLGVAILDFSTLHNTRERLPVAQHIKPLTWPSGAPPPLPGSHTEIKQREVQNPEVL